MEIACHWSISFVLPRRSSFTIQKMGTSPSSMRLLYGRPEWRQDLMPTAHYQHEFCNLWNRLVLTARNDNDPQSRSTTIRMFKRTRNIYVALHASEGIDTTGLTLEICNDDPALNRASSYPWGDTHHHISTLIALPSPEMTAKTTETFTPPPSPHATSGPRVYPLSVYPVHRLPVSPVNIHVGIEFADWIRHTGI
jgi:hypothetical protein